MSAKNTILDLITTNLASASNITATELRAVLTAMVNDTSMLYEVKELDVDNTFITTNFDSTGLGIDAFDGWAICNGQNGTKDRGGLVSLGYDATNYDTLGETGGSKDAVVVSHSHYTTVYGTETVGNGGSLFDGVDANRKEQSLSAKAQDQNSDAFDYELVTVSGTADSGKTSTSGVSGTNANLQPYLVTLFIQRIA